MTVAGVTGDLISQAFFTGASMPSSFSTSARLQIPDEVTGARLAVCEIAIRAVEDMPIDRGVRVDYFDLEGDLVVGVVMDH
ncbi:hypothetical protein [Nocardia anaemiae]|uniref:hypothetical protein n=1 Tax=Nocardia anaemiae TaxID=263910 RepID=UPI0012F4E335|nr:hypothetical protein [Nocardia anaemiae]